MLLEAAGARVAANSEFPLIAKLIIHAILKSHLKSMKTEYAWRLSGARLDVCVCVCACGCVCVCVRVDVFFS